MTSVAHRVSDLEQIVKKVLIIQQNTELSMQKLHLEMRDFKDEMKDFKDEMRDFKDEMRDFKDDSTEFKKDMNRQWGNLANKLGSTVEDIIAPNIPELAKKYFGCKGIDRYLVHPYIRSKKEPSKRREFDVVVHCDRYIFLTNSKSTVSTQVIDEFFDFIKSDEFFDFFPEYSDLILIPIIASLSIRENLIPNMTKKGIIALVMSGDTMIPVNIKKLVNSFK